MDALPVLGGASIFFKEFCMKKVIKLVGIIVFVAVVGFSLAGCDDYGVYTCGNCNGTGDCEYCDGTGTDQDGYKCYLCKGTGDCSHCEGSGKTKGEGEIVWWR
jgi:uncharacterized lipoprotein YehR (DUF1307 family)